MDGGALKIISQLEDRQAKEGVQVSRGNIFLTRRGHVGGLEMSGGCREKLGRC